MELGALVSEAGFERGTILLHARSQGTEVLSGLGDSLVVAFSIRIETSLSCTHAAIKTHNNCEKRDQLWLNE